MEPTLALCSCLEAVCAPVEGAGGLVATPVRGGSSAAL